MASSITTIDLKTFFCSNESASLNSHTSSTSALYREAIRAALLGMVINIVLGVVKLTAGILGGSFALISDAVNNWSDVFICSWL